MAKAVKAPVKAPEAVKMCIGCKHAEPVHEFGRYDTEGQPIMLQCKYSKFKRLRKDKGCAEWVKK